jgi:hypothetical protein
MPRRFVTKESKHFRKDAIVFFLGVVALSFVLVAGSIFVMPEVKLMLRPAAGTSSINGDSKISGRVFSDVSESYTYAESIAYLKNLRVVTGYGDGTFKPDDKLKRDELAKLLVSAHKAIPHELTNSYCFKDVGSEWFARYVCFAKSKGWVQGYADGKFYPEKNLSRDEAERMIAKSFGFKGSAESATDAGAAVDAAKDPALTQEISRGEAADILTRAIEASGPL